jgi:uncharacterized protein
MDNAFVVAFITGLTAGGLSCFAVQGGLLTGSIAHQVEADVQARGTVAPARPPRKPGVGPARSALAANPGFSARMLQPILLFSGAKLVAYTILGFFLGLLGSVFTFSPFLQGTIQVAIGIFLVGNALRMLNVHPIFRYFSFEPPSSWTRYIRKVSKRGDAWFTPLFLGALTILIPCGVTQSMMAVAVASGNPWTGAMIMFAFVLGASPTFMAVTWLATSLGSLFQKYFLRVVAVIVLFLGLWSINSGLVLVDAPISSAKIARSLQGLQGDRDAVVLPGRATPANSANTSAAGGSEAAAPAAGVVQINVKNSGYSPDALVLPANQAIQVHLVTQKTTSCSRAFVIPALGVQELLPETGDKVVNIPPQKAGTTVDFMCSMGMYTGVMEFR